MHQKWMVVAETQYAVQVCAERIHNKLLIYGDSLNRIFVVGRSIIEDADFVITASEPPSGGLSASKYFSTVEMAFASNLTVYYDSLQVIMQQ